MRKVRKFVLSTSCKALGNEEMIEIVGGESANKGCNPNPDAATCFGMCSYNGIPGSCTIGSPEGFKRCYCTAEFIH